MTSHCVCWWATPLCRAPRAPASPIAAVSTTHCTMSSPSYKERVVAIYQKYDPSKVGQADATLEKYKGKEEQVISALVKKYGPEPNSAASPVASPRPAEPASGSGSPRSYKDRVVAIYQKYDPTKVGQADATLDKYKGKEEQVISALVKKYGPEPTEPSTATAPAAAAPPVPSTPRADETPRPANSGGSSARGSYKERVVAIYQKYDPSKVGQADATLEKYKGKEEQVISALVKKYGPEPTEASAAPATVEPTAAAVAAHKDPSVGATAATPRSYKDRVVAIYQKYEPAKVGQADATLEKFKGKEEQVIAALVKKYGPEPPPPAAHESASSPAPAAPAPTAAAHAASPAAGTPAPLSYKERVVAIYQKYDPTKVGQADATLDKYKGKEEQVISALVKKYGPEPVAAVGTDAGHPASPTTAHAAPTPPSTPRPSSGRTYKERVVAIYQKYDPSKVGQADATLDKYKGKEEQVISALVKKYGPEPAASGPSTPRDESPAAAQSPAPPVNAARSYKERVVAIYQKYDPSKIGQADATLDKYKGKEEQVISALVKKYGPEPTFAASPAAAAVPEEATSSSPPRPNVPRVRFEMLPDPPHPAAAALTGAADSSDPHDTTTDEGDLTDRSGGALSDRGSAAPAKGVASIDGHDGAGHGEAAAPGLHGLSDGLTPPILSPRDAVVDDEPAAAPAASHLAPPVAAAASAVDHHAAAAPPMATTVAAPRSLHYTDTPHCPPAQTAADAAAIAAIQRRLQVAVKRLTATRQRIAEGVVVSNRKKMMAGSFDRWQRFAEGSVCGKEARRRCAEGSDAAAAATALSQRRALSRMLGVDPSTVATISSLASSATLSSDPLGPCFLTPQALQDTPSATPGAVIATKRGLQLLLDVALLAIRDKLTTAERTHDKLTQEITSIKVQRDKSQSDKEHAHARVLSLAAQLSQSQRDVKGAEESLQRKTVEIADLKSKITSLTAIVEGHAEKYTKLQHELSAERRGLPSRLEVVLCERDDTIAKLTQQLSKLRTDAHGRKEVEDRLKQDVATLTDLLQRYRRRALSPHQPATAPLLPASASSPLMVAGSPASSRQGGGFSAARRVQSSTGGLGYDAVKFASLGSPSPAVAAVTAGHSVRVPSPAAHPSASSSLSNKRTAAATSPLPLTDEEEVLLMDARDDAEQLRDEHVDPTDAYNDPDFNPEETLRQQSQTCGSCPNCDLPLTSMGDGPSSLLASPGRGGSQGSSPKQTTTTAAASQVPVAFCFSCRKRFTNRDIRARDLQLYNRRSVSGGQIFF